MPSDQAQELGGGESARNPYVSHAYGFPSGYLMLRITRAGAAAVAADAARYAPEPDVLVPIQQLGRPGPQLPVLSEPPATASDDTFGWSADKQEIIRLQSLAARRRAEPARSAPTDGDGGQLDPLIARLASGDADQTTVHKVLSAVTNNPRLREAVSDFADAGQLASIIEHSRQMKGLLRLERTVRDPASTVAHLYGVLKDEPWVFGGRFVPQDTRYRVPGLKAVDLPILRPNDILHVVRLAPANIPDLAAGGRNSAALGVRVHEAVSESMNLLRSLDELRHRIFQELQIDTRRASVTIVIGSPEHLGDGSAVPGWSAIEEAIRVYNSHLSRIEVMTYEDLVRSARRMLRLAERIDTEGLPMEPDLPQFSTPN